MNYFVILKILHIANQPIFLKLQYRIQHHFSKGNMGKFEKIGAAIKHLEPPVSKGELNWPNLIQNFFFCKSMRQQKISFR